MKGEGLGPRCQSAVPTTVPSSNCPEMAWARGRAGVAAGSSCKGGAVGGFSWPSLDMAAQGGPC